MAADLVAAVLRANVGLTLCVAFVLALRGTARRRLGADAAYWLWILAPVGVVAALASPGLDAPANAEAALWLEARRAEPVWSALAFAWAGGAALVALAFALGLRRAVAKGERGELGPAAVGVLFPRIFMPADFEQRFDPAERALISAHERAHLARHDLRINAFAAALLCLSWFNPLLWWAMRRLRLDQEMACDAQVLAAPGRSRRLYAQAMIKAQMAGRAPRLACGWRGARPLEVRLAALATPAPSVKMRRWGLAAVAAGAVAAGALVWMAQPFRPPIPRSERPLILFMDLRPPHA